MVFIDDDVEADNAAAVADVYEQFYSYEHGDLSTAKITANIELNVMHDRMDASSAASVAHIYEQVCSYDHGNPRSTVKITANTNINIDDHMDADNAAAAAHTLVYDEHRPGPSDARGPPAVSRDDMSDYSTTPPSFSIAFLTTLSIGALKAALDQRGLSYAGFVEKRELVALLEQAVSDDPTVCEDKENLPNMTSGSATGRPERNSCGQRTEPLLDTGSVLLLKRGRRQASAPEKSAGPQQEQHAALPVDKENQAPIASASRLHLNVFNNGMYVSRPAVKKGGAARAGHFTDEIQGATRLAPRC